MAGAVEARLGIRVQAEFRARAAADEHKAGLFAARHIGRLVIGDKILVQIAAVGRGLTGLEEAKVLDEVGHALQRPSGKPRRDRLARLLILLVHNSVDGWIDLLGPCDRCLQHVLGADFTLGDQPGKGDGVMLAIFFKPHGLRSPLKPKNDYSDSDLATSYLIAPRVARRAIVGWRSRN